MALHSPTFALDILSRFNWCQNQDNSLYMPRLAVVYCLAVRVSRVDTSVLLLLVSYASEMCYTISEP